MANREDVYIRGKVKWLKAVTANDWNKWTVVVYPVADDLEKIRDLQGQGLKNVLKKDEDGYYTTFSRPVNKVIRGKVIAFHPPKIVDKDNQPLDPTKIGNGSDATIKLEVYEHGTPGGGKAKAARWEAARIDNLVPYEPDRDFTDSEKAAVAGLKDQPEQFF